MKSKCKRIVRIETLAAELFSQKMSIQSTKPSDILFRDFQMAFEAEIERLLDDQDVVGFKSVICYRGGLDIPGSIVGLLERAKISFTAIIALHGKGVNPFKHPDQLPLNHFLVHSVARALSTNDIRHKPIQFHTGLGDTDITLTKSSPAHLQPFINRYPTVPMVLLHSSYPWTREAGYLATMYPNVYADIGEVFPFLNQDGQEGILRQILELTPWSKVLMSTDGHSHPEMYLIALSQIRSVMKTVWFHIMSTAIYH